LTVLPHIEPIRPVLRREPFNDSDWIFELKHDGFRALAYIESGAVRLVSRNGNVFKSFPGLRDALATTLNVRNSVLDGEIVCVDANGRSQFNDLLFRRGDPRFYAVDLLWLNGKDLRNHPLLERKQRLREMVPPQPSPLLYANDIAENGIDFFRLLCAMDLEGVVAKRGNSAYEQPEHSPNWLKIRNPNYTRYAGRHDLFATRQTR
jgi:bifunctional non-homologous end joining protein LigD